MLPVLIDPGCYFAEFIQSCFAKSVPAALFDFDETTISQDLHVKRNRLLAYVKHFGDGFHIQRLSSDHIDDRSPGRVGYCLVYITSGFHNYTSKWL